MCLHAVVLLDHLAQDTRQAVTEGGEPALVEEIRVETGDQQSLAFSSELDSQDN
jgi:hypothetical protein